MIGEFVNFYILWDEINNIVKVFFMFFGELFEFLKVLFIDFFN